MECFSPTKEYVEACLKRSRSRLLDITIKFPRHITATNYALEQVVAKMSPIIGIDASSDLYGTLLDADWQCNSSLVEERVTHIENVTKSLIGPNGEHVLRWGSLSMTLSEDDWGNFFLARMEDYPAPGLQQLEIINISFSTDWFQYGGCSFPTMLRLRSLKTDWPCLHWLNPQSAALTHLDTTYGGGVIFDHLSGFQKLHRLCIRDATDTSSYSKDSITLSQLSELHIYGDVNQIIAILVAPQLEKLVVFSSQTRFKRPLPSVPLVEWTFDKTDAYDFLQYITLTSIFENMTETRRLSLQGFKAELVDDVRNKLKREGRLPTSLKVVEVLVDDARIIICD